jgi:MSHA biogenesis protein MshP
MKTCRARQQGFAAIVAVFLVVVLAALGAFMVTFSNTQQLTSAQDVQGSRAYWAARAGLEWGIASVTAACPASPTTLSVDGFTVIVTCALTTYSDPGSVNLFQITAVANTAGAVGSPSYIERSLTASMEK